MAKEFNHDSVFEGVIQIKGGTPALNKVLTSDASGNATWEVTQIPTLALTDVNVVANEAAQLALVGQEEGDVAIRSDENKSYVHNGGTAGTMADWSELLTPASPVSSVNTQTGAVVLDADDISDATTTNKWNITTDLSIGTKTATTVDVNSSDGTNATIPAATATEAGLITATQFGTIEDVKSVRKVITTAAGGAGTVIAHTLGTANLHVSTYDSAGNEISTEVHKDATNVTITTAAIETNMEVIISTAPNITTLV